MTDTDTPKSSGERHIERIMDELDPSSDRFQVLQSAKRFKSSWVELGDRLLTVNSRSLFREWGYGSFEEYCTREIRIKKETAQKLTLAYRFMEKHEPELMARREEPRPLPDYRSIDLLRQAREEKGFSDEEYADLRKSVVEQERSHPTVLKQFREVAKSRQEPVRDPAVPLRAALAAARRLDTALEGVAELPDGYRDLVGEIITHLEGELEESEVRVDEG
ncbi:hypothetical protein [Geobacter pickeringii]|uniref:DUF3102 domain-containing protein n=1 Tax=Geobacter pickeringii TaxID=345632 RepID=A0A0B5BIW1_9BACT|nr:hypothetical protein [Geobacter pickeringii]AJE03991.1 hypothetical protein GPICK_12060 [Geobacter pickeringii]